jgi:hypothetical protein
MAGKSIPLDFCQCLIDITSGYDLISIWQFQPRYSHLHHHGQNWKSSPRSSTAGTSSQTQCGPPNRIVTSDQSGLQKKKWREISDLGRRFG